MHRVGGQIFVYDRGKRYHMNVHPLTYVSPFDAQILHGYHYKAQKPKALVVIFHGLADHQARYRWVAEQLVKADYDVLTIDQRGHGESLFDTKVKGYFGDKDGWDRNLADLHAMVSIVHDAHPLPILLFGHSMGSLVARHYLKRYPEHLKAVYLSGTPDQSPLAKVGILIAGAVALLRGPRHPSPLLKQLSFGTFNKAFKDPKTPMDWLSADEQNVQDYLADEFCGFDTTAQGYVDMLKGMNDIYSPKGWKILDPKLPIRFESGQLDPSHQPGGLEHSVDLMRRIGYSQVDFAYIEGCHHEIYRDVEKNRLIKALISWYDAALSR